MDPTAAQTLPICRQRSPGLHQNKSPVAAQGTTPEGIAPIGLPSPPGRPALLANESFLRSPSFLGKADPRSLVGSASLMKVRGPILIVRPALHALHVLHPFCLMQTGMDP